MNETTVIALSTIVTHGDEQVSADIEDKLVILDVERSHYYGTGAVGRRIWELIARPQPVSAVCETLTKEYDIDREACEREVRGFLHELLDEGLVKLVDEADG